MLEDPSVVLRDMTLENPIRAIREISHDITCKRRVRLANGREASALDIQTEYLNRAHALRRDQGPQPARGAGARHVGALPHRARAKDPLTLDRECDWVIKHHLIEALPRQARPAAHPPQGRADGPPVPRRQPRARPLLPDAGAGHGRPGRAPTTTSTGPGRRLEPPQTTRARLRGEFIRKAKERKRDYTVDWVHLKLNDQAQRTVLCKDPFKAQDERVERLIASL